MAFITSILQNLIPFLCVLTILVFVHELGHYLVARLNGVHVEIFSIGFGPELAGWTDKHQTRWRLSLIPLGGYVRMLGDLDAASRPDGQQLSKMNATERQQALHHKHPKQRIAVSAAGPAANFALAFVILSGIFMTIGQPMYLPVIGLIHPDSAAEKAGLKLGDRLLSINGVRLEKFEQIPALVNQYGTAPLTIQVGRQGQEHAVTLEADMVEKKNNLGGIERTYRLGIGRQDIDYIKRSPLQAILGAAQEIYAVSKGTLCAFGRLILGTSSSAELGGPLRIAQLSGNAAQLGITALLLLTAMLSINLGLINLLPVPMLDGGHIFMQAIEWITGRPLSEKTQEIAYRIGLFLVGGLMIFSMWSDIIHLRIIENIISFF